MSEGVSTATLQSRLVVLEEDKTRLEADKAELNSRITTIDAEIAVLDASINDINSTLTANNSVPSIASISPNFYTVDSIDTLITVTGTNFVAATEIFLNGLAYTTAQDGGSPTTIITCTIPASLLDDIGTLSVYVSTPEPGGGTTSTLTAQIINGVPTLITATPSAPGTITAGDTGVTILAVGAFYTEDSVIYLNQIAQATTVVGVDLRASVPDSYITVSGVGLDVRIKNPIPGGGTSNPIVVPVL